MTKRNVTQAVSLQPIHVQNARICPSRHHVLNELPKGGVWGEIGVAFGDYSEPVLKHVRPIRFHAIDLFDLEKHKIIFGKKSADIFKGSTHEDYYRKRFATEINCKQMILHKGFSVEVLNQFDDEYFDVLYIDAAHDYANVMKDLNVAKKKIKINGLIILNDYVMNNPFDGQLYGVVQATNEICVNEGWEILYFALHPFMFCDVVIRRIGVNTNA